MFVQRSKFLSSLEWISCGEDAIHTRVLARANTIQCGTQQDLLWNIIRNDNNKFVTLNLSNETIGLSTIIYLRSTRQYVYQHWANNIALQIKSPRIHVFIFTYIFSFRRWYTHRTFRNMHVEMLAPSSVPKLLFSYLYLFNGWSNSDAKLDLLHLFRVLRQTGQF